MLNNRLLQLSIGSFLLIFTFSTLSSIVVGAECLVPCDEIVSGGPPKDGIPAIDLPQFITATEFENKYTQSYLNDLLVLGVIADGEARAYPHDILNWHEIVNDQFQGSSLSITFCPLTGTGICYNTTTISGSTLGTTGKLYENNLVFYDRGTDTSWSQMLGLAITGEKIGDVLPKEPIIETEWNTWKKLYPDTVVLSRSTGYFRDYDRTPYPRYRDSSSIWFPTSYQSSTKPYSLYFEKALTLILEVNGVVALYPFEELSQTPILNMIQGDHPIGIIYDDVNNLVIPFNSTIASNATEFTELTFHSHDGNGIDPTKTLSLPVFQDEETMTVWNLRGEAIEGPLENQYQLEQLPSFNGFWFAATSFFPNAKIYDGNILVTYEYNDNDSGNNNESNTTDSLATSAISIVMLVPLSIITLFFYRRFSKKNDL